MTKLASSSNNKKVKSTDDVLLILCNAVKDTLTAATGSRVIFSPVVQRISRTCLKPDLGCFTLFDGGFSGLVVMNFTAPAAMELYRRYLLGMGMPEDGLVKLYTSDEVSNTLGELMNQIIGKYQVKLQNELMVSVNQSQPRMLVLNKELVLAVNAKLDQPQSRKVTFLTQDQHPFYIEMSMEKTEFVELLPGDRPDEMTPDELLEANRNEQQTRDAMHQGAAAGGGQDNDDLLAELGI